MKRGRPATIPPRLLVTLLYSTHSYVERELPAIVAPTIDLCRQLNITSLQLRVALEWLEEHDLIEKHKWYRHYFIAYPKLPKGMIFEDRTISAYPDTDEGKSKALQMVRTELDSLHREDDSLRDGREGQDSHSQ